eukprot:12807938-Alexandrium_andersonii.AAC.1
MARNHDAEILKLTQALLQFEPKWLRLECDAGGQLSCARPKTHARKYGTPHQTRLNRARQHASTPTQ